MNRIRDFKHITQNVGKGKTTGLRNVQDVDAKVCRVKERIEHKLREFNEMNFSKLKESKSCKDKTCTNLNDDEIREKASNVE